MLSQRSQKDCKIHPCAFFSHRLTTAEQNYDVGNHELLAIRLALEEWRHWLEGAEQPFIIWTDHKNLSYIQSAKWLNSRQARWLLFFARFNFVITYRPGSRNIKPDPHSCLFSTSETTKSDTTVLPTTCFVGTLTWSIEEDIKRAQRLESDPGTGPSGKMFLSKCMIKRVLDWVHNHRFTCHPGINRMLSFSKNIFLVANYEPWHKRFCHSHFHLCTEQESEPATCRTPPSTPHTWSHISLDFITRLPPSEGNTVIDRFSKAAHFIPLPKLPTALETAQLLVQHVFRQHGIPLDVVSKRGPQFSSQVWRAFL